MKRETLERANKLNNEIGTIGDILSELRMGKHVRLQSSELACNISPFKRELVELLEKTKARLEAELERL